MNKLKRIVTLTLVLFCVHAVMAQGDVPAWKDGYLKELRKSYVKSGYGIGRSVSDARDAAATQIIRGRSDETGAAVHISNTNGHITTKGEDDLVVKFRIVDEYVETLPSGEYKVYVLAQVAKHPDHTFEELELTRDYPFSLRAFVPGMEQIHKGQKGKGIAFIIGEVACIGGIVAAESLRADNENLIASTYNQNLRSTYTDRVNTWSNVRNGFIAAAAAVYVWNFIDAVTSKGARHVEYISLVPYASPQATGLAMNINF